ATVASAIPGPSAGRITDQRVVRPPSARIRTNPPIPNAAVSAVLEYWTPSPASLINRPMTRYSSSDGNPSRVDTRTASTATSNTAAPAPSAISTPFTPTVPRSSRRSGRPGNRDQIAVPGPQPRDRLRDLVPALQR